jgi:antitoxin component YwqK of YwqJK toxin-antitoxin module
MKIPWTKILLGVCFILALGEWALQVFVWPMPVTALQPQTIPLARMEVRDQRLYRGASAKPFTGVVIEHYPTGVLKSRAQVVDGKLNGLSEGWHTNGVLQVEEHFKQGISNGQRIKWHVNGTKASECEIADGKLNGLFRRWNEDATLVEEIQMRNGEPHGMSFAYYRSGFIKTRAKLENGGVIEQKSWKDGEEKPGN